MSFTAIKQEKDQESISSIIKNAAIYEPEFVQIKAEPEESYCMEVDNQSTNTSGLKIESVTQLFDDSFGTSKRKRADKKIKTKSSKGNGSAKKSSIKKVSSSRNLEDTKAGTKSKLKVPKKPKKLGPKPMTVKSEPTDIQSPLHLPIPDHFQIIDYEPKIATTKKRREIRAECDHCGRVFKSKYSVIWHMKEHMLTMPFNCSLCGKGFSYERSFRQHEMSHASKVKCEICSKKLKPHAMYYHMKYRHTDEKQHQCTLCTKRFKTKDNISRHMMRHLMEFKCSICERQFPENSRLQMHMRMHENPEEFHCKLCDKSFEHIDRHMKRLHGQKRERNLKCKFCEYASDSRQTMNRHEEMHEKRNEIIKSKGKRKSGKIKMMEMKTFECKVCNVVLQTKCGYKSHLRHYHDGKEVDETTQNDESSVGSETFVEVKVEQEEVSVIQ